MPLRLPVPSNCRPFADTPKAARRKRNARRPRKRKEAPFPPAPPSASPKLSEVSPRPPPPRNLVFVGTPPFLNLRRRTFCRRNQHHPQPVFLRLVEHMLKRVAPAKMPLHPQRFPAEQRHRVGVGRVRPHTPRPSRHNLGRIRPRQPWPSEKRSIPNAIAQGHGQDDGNPVLCGLSRSHSYPFQKQEAMQLARPFPTQRRAGSHPAIHPGAEVEGLPCPAPMKMCPQCFFNIAKSARKGKTRLGGGFSGGKSRVARPPRLRWWAWAAFLGLHERVLEAFWGVWRVWATVISAVRLQRNPCCVRF